MSSKEATPATSDAKPSSDTKPSTPVKKDGEKPLFTEKEERLLKVAMAHCLKSGPPEIDIQKFMTHGEFNTMKTAQNTWGKIKAKLTQAAGAPKEDGDGEGEDGEKGNATPKTPKTPKTPASKKRGKKADADADAEDGEAADGDGSPKKKRKSSVKKTSKKAKAEEDGEGEGEADVMMEDE